MSQYTPFVEDLNQYFTPEELAAFSPAIIKAATIDGALQLIPRHADISAMHYRTDLFGDADLQAKFEAKYGYPLAPPETIDQMKEMAEFFVEEKAIDYGTQFAGKEEALAGRFYELLVANGGNYFDESLRADLQLGRRQDDRPVDEGPLRRRRDPQRHDEPAVARSGAELLRRQGGVLPGVVRLVQLLPEPGNCKVAGKFDMVRGPLGAEPTTSTPAGPARMPSRSPRPPRTRKVLRNSSSS